MKQLPNLLGRGEMRAACYDMSDRGTVVFISGTTGLKIIVQLANIRLHFRNGL